MIYRTAACVVVFLAAAVAVAGECGAPSKSACCQKGQPQCRWVCEKVMRTMTRTCYDYVDEVQTDTVYDTVWDEETVTHSKHITNVHYRDEPFTYTKVVPEVRTREVPYTVCWPVCETRTRDVSRVDYVPSYETRTRTIPYTTWHTVCEQRMRTVRYCVPRQVQFTRTIAIPCGHWEHCVEEHPGPVVCQCCQEPGCWVSNDCCGGKGSCQKDCCQKGCGCHYQPGAVHIVQRRCPPVRVCRKVWVPHVEYRTVCCCRTEYDVCTYEIPYTVTRCVPTTHVCEQPYTICRMTPITRCETIEYQVTRMMTQQCMRTEEYTVNHTIEAMGMRRVPFTTECEVPTTCCVRVPRQVPREVCRTVRRCIPRTETYQVPVYIRRQVPCGCPCKGCPTCDAASEIGAPQFAHADDDANDEAPAEFDAGDLIAPPTFNVSHKQSADDETDAKLASDAFANGLAHFRAARFEAAASEFETAAAHAPTAAKYAYFHAIALYQLQRTVDAELRLAEAVQLEAEHPVADWGRAMERVQGRARLWVEAARQSQ
ncbi:MAG: hypothetical protein KDA41_21250 [Planctomycetales bacterium]|nr:hypothetical protein [Planctomycetales bacterium]